MKELEGPELAVAVARVLRLHAMVESDTCLVAELDDPHYTEWRPDLGGAAAWAVLEWVRERGHAVQYATHISASTGEVRRCAITDSSDLHTGTGPTDAIALCRAVVALGEA